MATILHRTRRVTNSMRITHWLGVLSVFFCILGSTSAQSYSRAFGLQAIAPQFWNLVDRNAKLDVVASGFGFTEGPTWEPGGVFYVRHRNNNKIFRVFPDGKKEAVIELGDPDGNTFDREHRLIDCASVLRAIIAVTPDGKYKILGDPCAGQKQQSTHAGS